MLYLARSAEGTPMAMHAFAEYLEPCSAADIKKSGRKETLRRVDRIQISDLSLGAGSSRKSFLERITAVTLLATVPGPGLQGAVKRRAAAPVAAPDKSACKDSPEVALFTSPRQPHPGEPVRVIATAARDLGSEWSAW